MTKWIVWKFKKENKVPVEVGSGDDEETKVLKFFTDILEGNKEDSYALRFNR